MEYSAIVHKDGKEVDKFNIEASDLTQALTRAKVKFGLDEEVEMLGVHGFPCLMRGTVLQTGGSLLFTVYESYDESIFLKQ